MAALATGTRPLPKWLHTLDRRLAASALVATAALAGCGGDDNNNNNNNGNGATPVAVNNRPSFVVGAVTIKSYDGSTDDLLTGGLGKTGLGAATGPTFAVPATPTAAELRKAAIYNNYRALVDPTAAGGYGTLYGPNVDIAGNVTTSEGKIAGIEYTAYSDDGSGRENVTLLVQIPATFDPANPCIETATSSGSRGVYGAISAAEWGLKRGCAVALTDKGTSPVPHDLQADTVGLIDGTRTTSTAAGAQAVFRANLTAAQLATFNAATPNRLAFKHAHSQRNPEKDWGKFTLQAVEFAFYALNDRYGAVAADGNRTKTIVPANTIVIASAASNGAGSALAAAELDTTGLIDGIAVAEPNVEIPPTAGIVIQRGGTTVANTGKPLYDYFTNTDLYSLCATLSTQLVGTPGLALIAPTQAAARCQSLKDAGLLTATTTATQADEALTRLRTYGYSPESGRHLRVAGRPGDVQLDRGHVRELVLAGERRRQPVRVQLRRDRRDRQSDPDRRGHARRVLRGRQRHPARQRRAADQQRVGRRREAQRAVDLAVDEPDRLQHRRGALPARPADDVRRAADRDRRDLPQRQPARQAGDHRPRPRRRPDPRQPHVATLPRHEQAGRRREQQAVVHRGDQRPALRHLHRPADGAAGLRLALRAAAPVPDPGAGRGLTRTSRAGRRCRARRSSGPRRAAASPDRRRRSRRPTCRRS